VHAFCCSYTHNFHNRLLQPALLAAFLLASYISRIFPEVVEMTYFELLQEIYLCTFLAFCFGYLFKCSKIVRWNASELSVVIDSSVGTLKLYLFREMLKMGIDFWQIVPKVSEFHLHWHVKNLSFWFWQIFTIKVLGFLLGLTNRSFNEQRPSYCLCRVLKTWFMYLDTCVSACNAITNKKKRDPPHCHAPLYKQRWWKVVLPP
jgi:hypothetical protein